METELNKIEYFISYKWYKDKSEGYGNISYKFTRKIDVDLIRAIEFDLKKECGFKQCLVLHFIKL
tara:strand:+ start:18801 stop:18995 length:195 start_codon:yes stop_codon:yes gene_type:complete